MINHFDKFIYWFNMDRERICNITDGRPGGANIIFESLIYNRKRMKNMELLHGNVTTDKD